MTNQEAMRGRAEEMLNQMMAEAAKPSIRSIKGPTIPQIADKITEFTLQELASRDARITKLEAAAKPAWELITALALAVEWELAPEIKAALKINSKDLGEALKEQP